MRISKIQIFLLHSFIHLFSFKDKRFVIQFMFSFFIFYLTDLKFAGGQPIDLHYAISLLRAAAKHLRVRIPAYLYNIWIYIYIHMCMEGRGGICCVSMFVGTHQTMP